jgi:nitrate reductase NapE component
VARTAALIAAVFALAGIVAGILQHGDLALWCIPPFVVFGAISATTNEDAGHARRDEPAEAPSVGRHIREGILGTFLVLVLLALGLIGYFFFMIWMRVT